MTKNETIELLKNQLPGFYSVEQVIEMINGIEDESQTTKITLDKLREITNDIVNSIENERDLVEYDDVEFEINYNKQIEVTDVPINFDAIRDCVEQCLSEHFESADEE